MTVLEQPRTMIRILVNLLIFTYCAGAIASLIRLRFGDEATYNLAYQRALVPVLVACCVLIGVRNLKHTFDAFASFLLFLIIYAFGWGLYNNGLTYIFVTHLFAAALGLFGYLAGRETMFTSAALFRAELRRLCVIVTAVHIPVMLIYVYLALSGAVYFGMSANILILCTIFFLDERRWKWAAAAVIMVLISGKRGEIIGLVMAISCWFATKGVHSGFASVAKYLLGGLAAIMILVGASLVGVGSEIAGDLGAKFSAFLSADWNDLGSTTTRGAIGGRGIEIVLFSETFFAQGLGRLLTGLGFGWNVVITTAAGAEVDTLYFVHVSPLNSIGLYGLLLAGLYWAWLFWIPAVGLLRVRQAPGNRVMTPYAVGMIFVAFTAYVISVEPMFWIALGACSMTGKISADARARPNVKLRRPLPS